MAWGWLPVAGGVVVLAAGCVARSEPTAAAAGGARPLAVSAGPDAGPATPAAGGQTIAGTVYQIVRMQCGGARVNPNRPLSQRGPWAGQTLAVLRGQANDGSAPVAHATTDGGGRFLVSLPAGATGTFCLVESARAGPFVPGAPSPHVDPVCLAAEHRRCDAVVDLAARPGPITIELHRPCFGPCYRGPPPP